MSIPNFMFDGVNILQRVREASNDDLVQVAYRLAETHPQLFCRLLTDDLTVDYTFPGNSHVGWDVAVKISRKEMETLKGFGSNDKVRAVKWLRETYGIGLKEAKDLSEWLVRDGHLPHKCWMPEWLTKQTMKPLADGWSREQKSDMTCLGDILNAQLAENSAVRTVRSNAQIRADFDDDIPF